MGERVDYEAADNDARLLASDYVFVGIDAVPARNLARAYLALRLLPTGAAGEGVRTDVPCLYCIFDASGKRVRACPKCIAQTLKSTPAREPVADAEVAKIVRQSLGKQDRMAYASATDESILARFRDTANAVRLALYTHPPTPEAGTVTEAMVERFTKVLDDCGLLAEINEWGQPVEQSVRELLTEALAGRRGA